MRQRGIISLWIEIVAVYSLVEYNIVYFFMSCWSLRHKISYRYYIWCIISPTQETIMVKICGMFCVLEKEELSSFWASHNYYYKGLHSYDIFFAFNIQSHKKEIIHVNIRIEQRNMFRSWQRTSHVYCIQKRIKIIHDDRGSYYITRIGVVFWPRKRHLSNPELTEYTTKSLYRFSWYANYYKC